MSTDKSKFTITSNNKRRLSQSSIDHVKNSKINKLTLASPQNEHNGTRLIYSLLTKPPSNNDRFALLNNGYYLVRTTRSDEKLRFTEPNMVSIINCILYMILFNISPQSSIFELMIDPLNINNFTPVSDKFEFNDSVKLCDFCDILDKLFGVGFSLIARRPIAKIWQLWLTQLRYKSCYRIRTPSVKDYLTLYRFMNVTMTNLSATAELLTFNTNDGRVYLQNAVKKL